MDIRTVDVEQIIDLRRAVLRTGRPRQAARFDGDEEETALHVAVFEDDRVIGCVSLIQRRFQGEPAWQLRGMAVQPDRQRRGIGRQMLKYVEAKLHHEGSGQLIWCNARTPVVAFYLRAGWQTVSEVFNIPKVGPHRRMIRRLDPRR